MRVLGRADTRTAFPKSLSDPPVLVRSLLRMGDCRNDAKAIARTVTRVKLMGACAWLLYLGLAVLLTLLSIWPHSLLRLVRRLGIR